MERCDALLKIKNFRDDEFNKKIEHQKLPNERKKLLFGILKGDIEIDCFCKIDIEEYALKCLLPEVYEKMPHDGHVYSSGELYEYDPPKNGQNIIKHGLGFGEVVSYSKKFGTLLVPCPDDKDEERLVVFSDLNLENRIYKLQLPLSELKDLNFIISIVSNSGGKFRFISSRIMSSKKKKYRETIQQSLRGVSFVDKNSKEKFVDRCVEIVDRDLIVV